MESTTECPDDWYEEMVLKGERRDELVEEMNLFMHQNPERNMISGKLRQIMSLYENWWMLGGESGAEPFERPVLNFIAKRAFWSDIKDSKFVSELLTYIFIVCWDFDLFTCLDEDIGHPLNPGNACLTIAEKNDFNSICSKFFLNHAFNRRLIFNRKRMVDVEIRNDYRLCMQHPCEIATVTGSKELLHTLLQYGALTTYDTVSLDHPLIGIIFDIILIFFKKETHPTRVIWENTEYNNAVTCGSLILRASPQFDKTVESEIHKLVDNIPGYFSPRQAIDYATEHGLKELSYRMYFPVPLMHACRLKVRRMLHDSWQLPLGIDELPLPNFLKRYLNLYYD